MSIIRKYIPDFLTAMNLVCGLIAILFAFGGRPDTAFLMMIAAAVFDFSDGFAARALHSYSDMGKELDSLCDLVSFGVLPAVLLHLQMKSASGDSWVCWIPLIVAVFSALRLAKFNVDERQHSSFIGLPTPASAMICAALCHYIYFNPGGVVAAWVSGKVFIPVLSVCLSALMVCGIPMFAMKFHREDSRIVKGKRLALLAVALVSAVLCAAFGLTWSAAVLLIFAMYILMNVIFAIFRV